MDIDGLSFPIGTLSDGRRIVLVYGTEFKQHVLKKFPTKKQGVAHKNVASTDLVYHAPGKAFQKQVLTFTPENFSALWRAPVVADEIEQQPTPKVEASTVDQAVNLQRGTRVMVKWAGEEAYPAWVCCVAGDTVTVFWDTGPASTLSLIHI